VRRSQRSVHAAAGRRSSSSRSREVRRRIAFEEDALFIGERVHYQQSTTAENEHGSVSSLDFLFRSHRKGLFSPLCLVAPGVCHPTTRASFNGGTGVLRVLNDVDRCARKAQLADDSLSRFDVGSVSMNTRVTQVRWRAAARAIRFDPG
jgi:hypothetical protein